MPVDARSRPEAKPPGVVVVGPCASGKSTLVAGLLEAGVDAWVAGQEHSGVRTLWARRKPDLVIALDLSLEHVRARRGQNWSAALYTTQHERLHDAFAHADLMLDTGKESVEDVRAAVLDLVLDYRRSRAS